VRRNVLIAIALVVPALSQWLVREIPVVTRTELLIYDWHSRALPPTALDPRLVLVGMDDESLSHLPLERPSYPLPRTMQAKVVTDLHEAGAKVIAFDAWFSRPIPSEDGAFAEAIEAAKPVLSAIEPSVQIVGGEEVYTLTPVAPLLRGHITLCSILAQPYFGRVRWILPFAVDNSTMERYPHLSVALAEGLGANVSQAPLGGSGEVLIRFAGSSGTIQPIPYYQVFDGSWKQSLGPNFFRGKAVLIGIFNPLVDRALTPVGEMQGVEVLGQAAQAMLQGNWIRPWSQTQNYVLKSVLCLLLVGAIWMLGLRRAFVFLIAEMILWIVAAHWMFIKTQVWADTFEPTFALLATLVVASAYETGRIRRVFHRFMPSWVAEDMLASSPGEAAVAQEMEATIVFCDVRNSTRLAETLPSQTVEELMRQYFTAGEEAAHQLGTELDKFVGDEIMLYFEDRRGLENQAVRALRWAFALQEACRRITESGLAGDIGFRVGVGICTGNVRIGTVGAKRRIQHTVMGDAVNTASRIQALTKEFNEPIVFSESTWDKVEEYVVGELIGEVPIRGKEHPIKLFKPIRMR